MVRQLGVSRSWASREATPRVDQRPLFGRTLDLIEDPLQTRNTLVLNGAVVDAGPDHYARLEAGKLFLRLLRHAR